MEYQLIDEIEYCDYMIKFHTENLERFKNKKQLFIDLQHLLTQRQPQPNLFMDSEGNTIPDCDDDDSISDSDDSILSSFFCSCCNEDDDDTTLNMTSLKAENANLRDSNHRSIKQIQRLREKLLDCKMDKLVKIF